MNAQTAHSHVHSHASSHAIGRSRNRRRLALTLVLIVGYMVAEVIGGLLTGSLALLADAGHMLSDAGSLALALFAMWISAKPRTSEHTFGYFRTEILAALVNGATLVAVSVFIFIEAYQRLLNPPEVRGGLMIAVAMGGLAVNLVALRILHGGRRENLNMLGAWLHVLADTLGSIQAILAGVLIWAWNWHWADPVASLLIGVLVIFSSWKLLKESVVVLMESSPGHIDVDQVSEAILEIPSVEDVHDLHVWTITSGMVALSAHIVCQQACNRDLVLKELEAVLEERFGIRHTTIQVEGQEFECSPGF